MIGTTLGVIVGLVLLVLWGRWCQRRAEDIRRINEAVEVYNEKVTRCDKCHVLMEPWEPLARKVARVAGMIGGRIVGALIGDEIGEGLSEGMGDALGGVIGGALGEAASLAGEEMAAEVAIQVMASVEYHVESAISEQISAAFQTAFVAHVDESLQQGKRAYLRCGVCKAKHPNLRVLPKPNNGYTGCLPLFALLCVIPASAYWSGQAVNAALTPSPLQRPRSFASRPAPWRAAHRRTARRSRLSATAHRARPRPTEPRSRSLSSRPSPRQGGVLHARRNRHGLKPGLVRAVGSMYRSRRVWIPAGRFVMGSPKTEKGRDDDEGPSTRIRISRGFWMWQTEVSQGEYRRVMRANPSRFSVCGKRCPVEMVSWHQAVAFAHRLSLRQKIPSCFHCRGRGRYTRCRLRRRYQRRKRGYVQCRGWRLPTEAEWEYAARGGTQAATFRGDLQPRRRFDAPLLGPIAWYSGNCQVRYRRGFPCYKWRRRLCAARRCGSHPVRQKQPNPWGLYDMLGNVWEWTWSRYSVRYPGGSMRDPTHLGKSYKRVARGGSWFRDARFLRAANRYAAKPAERAMYLGFRIVRQHDPRRP